MERPNARRVHLDLFYDYRTNVPLYPKWQAFLREHRPETIIFWGQNDIFFTPEGGEAYLADSAPTRSCTASIRDTSSIEDSLDEIAANIRRFYDEKVCRQGGGLSRERRPERSGRRFVA